MDLFSSLINPNTNLLSCDGIVNYHGQILDQSVAKNYFNTLFNTIEWKNDEANVFGKRIITNRKVAWYGDSNYSYTYSNSTKQALIWTKELLELKACVEKLTETTFNSCLLNLYHNGNEGMAYHSDDETSLGKNATIASLSFGAERRFLFQHKNTKETISIQLENGSLLVMKAETQAHWAHRLPLSTKIKNPRINLTFRTMI
jgi:alkylated DNA repair dioxygenase AlkB